MSVQWVEDLVAAQQQSGDMLLEHVEPMQAGDIQQAAAPQPAEVAEQQGEAAAPQHHTWLATEAAAAAAAAAADPDAIQQQRAILHASAMHAAAMKARQSADELHAVVQHAAAQHASAVHAAEVLNAAAEAAMDVALAQQQQQQHMLYAAAQQADVAQQQQHMLYAAAQQADVAQQQQQQHMLYAAAQQADVAQQQQQQHMLYAAAQQAAVAQQQQQQHMLYAAAQQADVAQQQQQHMLYAAAQQAAVAQQQQQHMLYAAAQQAAVAQQQQQHMLYAAAQQADMAQQHQQHMLYAAMQPMVMDGSERVWVTSDACDTVFGDTRQTWTKVCVVADGVASAGVYDARLVRVSRNVRAPRDDCTLCSIELAQAVRGCMRTGLSRLDTETVALHVSTSGAAHGAEPTVLMAPQRIRKGMSSLQLTKSATAVFGIDTSFASEQPVRVMLQRVPHPMRVPCAEGDGEVTPASASASASAPVYEAAIRIRVYEHSGGYRYTRATLVNCDSLLEAADGLDRVGLRCVSLASGSAAAVCVLCVAVPPPHS
jgi:hypothetical protein